MTRSLLAGVGVASGADLVLDLGAHHPSTHGALRLALQLDGDVVVRAEPVVGLLHRGAEKLFEVRDYRQVLVLANRHDWLSAFSNEIGIALAVERMMGLTVPPRALWLRTLLCELNRVHSHLVFLGADLVPRDAVQAVLEEATGGRIHYMANRVGGLLQDVPAGWTSRVHECVSAVRGSLPALASSVAARVDGLAGVGVLPVEVAASYGVSGPPARASGLDVDLRRDAPYLAYGSLPVPVVLRTAGDVPARFACLLEQIPVSLDLVLACLAALPGGPVSVRLPKTVRAPEGSTYQATENPLGTMGYFLVSRGERTPWRLAMRTASFNNVSVLPALLPGVRLADLPLVLASLFFVLGDVDK